MLDAQPSPHAYRKNTSLICLVRRVLLCPSSVSGSKWS
jgi:hypothetical protein